MVRASTTSQIGYDLRGLSGASRTAIYNVLAHAILVSAQKQIGYDIRTLTSRAGPLRYNLLGLSVHPATLFFDTRRYSLFYFGRNPL